MPYFEEHIFSDKMLFAREKYFSGIIYTPVPFSSRFFTDISIISLWLFTVLKFNDIIPLFNPALNLPYYSAEIPWFLCILFRVPPSLAARISRI